VDEAFGVRPGSRRRSPQSRELAEDHKNARKAIEVLVTCAATQEAAFLILREVLDPNGRALAAVEDLVATILEIMTGGPICLECDRLVVRRVVSEPPNREHHPMGSQDPTMLQPHRR
jgi:hypothetical protein